MSAPMESAAPASTPEEIKHATRKQHEELDAMTRRAIRRIGRRAEEMGVSAWGFAVVTVSLGPGPEGSRLIDGLNGMHAVGFAMRDLPRAMRQAAFAIEKTHLYPADPIPDVVARALARMPEPAAESKPEEPTA